MKKDQKFKLFIYLDFFNTKKANKTKKTNIVLRYKKYKSKFVSFLSLYCINTSSHQDI